MRCGTRTAAITGGYVALADAITWLAAAGRLDLLYEEDARAEVDMNVVATDAGTIVEIQGTGENATFTRTTLDTMLDLALAGCAEINLLQADALSKPYPGDLPTPKTKP